MFQIKGLRKFIQRNMQWDYKMKINKMQRDNKGIVISEK